MNLKNTSKVMIKVVIKIWIIMEKEDMQKLLQKKY